MNRFILIGILFAFYLPNYSYARSLQSFPQFSGHGHTKLDVFEIREILLSKGLVAYRAVYGLFDFVGKEDEAGEIIKGNPDIDCQYPGLKAKSVEEWGVINLEDPKASFFILTREPAKKKS